MALHGCWDARDCRHPHRRCRSRKQRAKSAPVPQSDASGSRRLVQRAALCGFGGRVLGAFSILGGAVLLSWHGGASLDLGAILIAGSCLCWGIDNNLTRKLSAADPVQIAMLKGLVAGVQVTPASFWPDPWRRILAGA